MDLELLKALICEVGQAAGFSVVSVKVLEEFLHPPHEDLMVTPTHVNLAQQSLSAELLQLRLDLTADVLNEGLGVAFVELCLEGFDGRRA